MRMNDSLVIVLIVNQDCVLAFEFEGQTPVSADADRPVSFESTGELVKPPSGSIDVCWLFGVVESKQLET